ncbi:hypothetical protein ANABIO32_03440 [Rossellomorea marisflavi]|uniref:hypothetical protein n=1 Tax=Rossellomorea marisflavi TaxID=189381 RepID=UPI0025C7CC7A|nr:hypothetical protein [Rossellomorea marisflavi]UTE73434.1 hypothetical protein M1I95_02480 [Rossellomorea marisflavi]GLI82657.1 hypothetical protein ANABIO32_03440 [Rossellomorea marisflavi]
MSKKEKRWRRFYLFLMIFIYAIFIPVTVLEWVAGDGRFPITAVAVGFGMPLIRKNHIQQLRTKG